VMVTFLCRVPDKRHSVENSLSTDFLPEAHIVGKATTVCGRGRASDAAEAQAQLDSGSLSSA